MAIFGQSFREVLGGYFSIKISISNNYDRYRESLGVALIIGLFPIFVLKNRHHIVTSNLFFQLKCIKLSEMVYFFPLHIILGVGKNHNLKIKK